MWSEDGAFLISLNVSHSRVKYKFKDEMIRLVLWSGLKVAASKFTCSVYISMVNLEELNDSFTSWGCPSQCPYSNFLSASD